MTRAELIREATAAVCGPIIEDYRKGRLDGVEGISADEKLREMIQRRQPAINDYIREKLAAKKTVVCAECGCPATTHMGGADYCDAHAQNHRMAVPAKLGVAA